MIIVIEKNYCGLVEFSATKGRYVFSSGDTMISVYPTEKSFRKAWPNAPQWKDPLLRTIFWTESKDEDEE